MVAAAGVAAVALMRRQLRLALAACAPLLAALGLLLASNLAGNGRLGISPYGSVFALARLVADGPARDVIARHCPAAGWRMCAWAGRLPADSDAFLWDPDGPVWTTPGGPKALAPEASAIVARTLVEEPGAVLRAAAANAWTQLWLVRLGDTLDGSWLEESVVGSLRAYFPPAEEARFRAGRQAHDAAAGRAAQPGVRRAAGGGRGGQRGGAGGGLAPPRHRPGGAGRRWCWPACSPTPRRAGRCRAPTRAIRPASPGWCCCPRRCSVQIGARSSTWAGDIRTSAS